MAEDVQPMLTEVRDSGLLQEVESLTKSLTQASEDLRCHTGFCTFIFSSIVLNFQYYISCF